MKYKFVVATLTMTISQLVSAQGQDLSKTNDRIDQLERRLAIYENNNSDGKMLGNQNNSGKSPVASTIKGVDLKMYGDVEFDADLNSNSDGAFMGKTQGAMFSDASQNEKWALGGRIKVGIDADQKSSSGNYVGVSVQPLAKYDGSLGLDDAFLKFGSTSDQWEIKVGRYEAYDMFPLHNDTVIEYSGNGSNEVYNDGYSYIYQMKEARGRTNDGAGVLVSKTVGDWYFENNTVIQEGTSIFKEDNYHGRELDNRRNSIYVRPVIQYSTGPYVAAAAYEGNLIHDAYGYTDNNGKFVSQSKRNGYGLTFSYDTTKELGDSGSITSLSLAYLDAKNENDFTVGINNLYQNLEVGYIYAHNDINNYNGDYNYNDTCQFDCDLKHNGKYDIHTLHASYKIPGVLGFDNFDAYVGAYASTIHSTALSGDHNDNRYGVRGRLKYYF